MWFGKSWNPDGLASPQTSFVLLSSYLVLQHTYITGGSSGLGLALSLILTSQGAHVSIVGRRQEVLDKALEAMEVCCGNF